MRSRLHILLLACLMLCCVQALAQNPTELLRQWEDNFYGKAVQMEIRMTITRPEWTRTASAKIWTMGHDYALVLVKEPKKDAGTVYLKRGNDIWNYVPSLERTLKLAPGMLAQSWMGSDFTHEDLVRKSSVIRDFDHRIIGTEMVEGTSCHVVELIPKEDAPVIWGKMKVWLSQKGNQQLRCQFFDEDNALVNTLAFGGIKTLGGRTIPTKLVMTPAGKKGWSTTLEYVAVNYDSGLTEAFFTQQNMTRVH
jgi:outer membrane lipoprotein-sorting protein